MGKINESEIVSTGLSVRPDGHEDLLWLRPDKVIVVGQKSKYSATGTKISAGSAFLDGSLSSGVTGPTGPTGPDGEDPRNLFPPSDAPGLSDIVSVTYYKYFDPVTKEEKVKAVIKIRNSSTKKAEVQGVDARIYQSGGA